MNENTFEMIQKKERIKSFMMASLPTDVQFQIIKASESSTHLKYCAQLLLN